MVKDVFGISSLTQLNMLDIVTDLLSSIFISAVYKLDDVYQIKRVNLWNLCSHDRTVSLYIQQQIFLYNLNCGHLTNTH